jgi:hypothetical protein
MRDTKDENYNPQKPNNLFQFGFHFAKEEMDPKGMHAVLLKDIGVQIDFIEAEALKKEEAVNMHHELIRFAEGYWTFHYLEFLKYELSKQSAAVEPQSQDKLNWKGKPAHLALIIDLLIEKGYLEKPSHSGDGTAEILLKHFKVGEKTNKRSLGKQLHKNQYPITDQSAIALFYKMPHRKV